MRRAPIAALLVALLAAAPASAALIDANDQIWTVAQGATTTISIYASPDAGDTGVAGVDMYLKVADGSSGPVITGVDLVSAGQGFFFEGEFQVGPSPATGRDLYTGTYFATGYNAIPDGVLLARAVVDATGVAPGDYAFSLSSATKQSVFTFEGAGSTSRNDGTIRVTSGVIPEPSGVVMLLGLGGMSLIWCRRRRKRSG